MDIALADETLPEVMAQLVIGFLLAGLIIVVGLLLAPLGKYKVK